MAMAVGYAILGAGATATAAAVVGSIVVGAITFTASYLLAKKAMGNMSTGMDSNDYAQMIKSDKAARRVIYGDRLVSGVMNFAEEQEGAQDVGEDLYLGIYVCDHEVNAITKVMLNDKSWDEYGGNADYVLNNGGDGIEARDWMMNGGYLPEPEPGEDPPETGKGAQQWSETMLGEGALWMGWKLNFNREYFTQIPTPKLLVEGKKIKDYRTDEIAYSNNAALVIADFLTSYMNVKESRIITSGWGSFIDAANLCDEVMDTGERRYTINGMFELADQKPSDILNAMLKACGGTLVRMNGKIGLLPAAYYGVATVTIGESDIISGLEVIPQEAMNTAANVISGSFISPADDFAKVDFEPIKDESAIARDGYEIDETIDYDLVTNEWQAQRLANIELRRRTLGSHINFKANMKGLYCRVGRVINLELPQIGISGEYRVLEQSLGEDGVSLSLQREDIDVYDDAVGSPYNPPPILNLPTGDVGSPTGLQFLAQAVGDTIQGKIVWTEVALAERYNVQLRNYDTDELVYATSTEATNTDVSGIKLGNYKARVQSVAASGKVSGWAEINFVISKPVKPTSVEVKRSNWNIQLVPTIAGGVPQGTLFDFYHIEDTRSYIEGQPTYDASNIGLAELVGRGSSLNHGGLIPDRFEHYWIISSNSYGASEAYYVQTGTTKEQDLVTTVVERLVAIEIESSNWDDATNTGYKIFSPNSDPYTMPDGTVLENPDGLIVVNQIVAKGHITAESLTFVSDDAIPDSINNEKAVEETKTYVDQNYVDAVTYGTDIADIQAQLDKSITSWFGDDTPTADNFPAVDWTTDELKDQHLGDLYYDNDDGLSYRWSIDNGTYLWIRVVDSGIEAALAAAAKAQDTADSKRRVFFATPVPPYDRGDLWDTGDGIKRCDVASTTSYSPSHWIWSTDGSGAADAAEENAKKYADELPNTVLFHDSTRNTLVRNAGSVVTYTFDSDKDGSGVIQVTLDAAGTVSWSVNDGNQTQLTAQDNFETMYFVAGSNTIKFWDAGQFTDPQIVINKVQITDITGNNAGQIVDDSIYPDQTKLEISGGGYKDNPNQGWGIHSNGYAEFLGGLNTKGATIEGATIIGADIYAGNILYHIDYNTDGDDDDVRYYDQTDVPLSARSSYDASSEATFIHYSDRYDYITGTFNVLSVLERRGSVNANRFRWGKIRSGAMRASIQGGHLDTSYNTPLFRFRLHLIDPLGNIIKTSSWRDGSGSLEFLGITWTANYNYTKVSDGGHGAPPIWRFDGGTINSGGGNWSSFDDDMNGRIRIEMGMRAYTTGQGNTKVTFYTTVDNDNFPA